MALQHTSIRPLPPESQAQIRSSVVITSLNDVITGLLENVLDAGATSAEIRLDYIKGYCSVTDNGIGIPAAEFERDGHLGSLHCTSKLDASHPTYGRYGRFLYHLAALSLLSITSRNCAVTSTVTIHRANIIARSDSNTDYAESISGEHGTHVVVANLFGDIPVRYRHIAARLESVAAAEAEFAVMRKRLAALILACGRAINIKMVDVRTKRSYKHKNEFMEKQISFDLGAIRSVLQQAGYIESSQGASFKLVSVQTSSVRIRAAISLLPAPAKDVQFISIGIRPIHGSSSTSLFSDEINAVFELSNFGALEDDVDLPEEEQYRRRRDRRFSSVRHTNRQLNGLKKGVDRWPMFYVRIDLQDDRASSALNGEQSESGLTERWVERVLDLLRSTFFEFLLVHHFRPRARKKRRLEKISLSRVAAAEPSSSSAGTMENATSVLPLRVASEASLLPKNFDAWSRVKLGSNTAKPVQLLQDVYQVGSLEIYERAPSRPQTPAERVQLAQNALGEMELQALDDEDLELLLEDYHDEAQSSSGTQNPDAGKDLELYSNGNATRALDIDEPTFLWTNPASGIEHMINARNGFILPQLNTNNTRPFPLNRDNSERPLLAPKDTTIAQRIRAKRMKKSPTELIAAMEQSDLVRSFRPLEERIPSIVPDEHDDTATPQQSHDCGHLRLKTSEYFSVPVYVEFHSLSKADLESAQVLAQVDQKYILIQTQASGDSDPLLVLIDQHAADERVRVEELYTHLCSGDATILSKPIIFEVAHREIELFQRYQARFAEWQISYEVRDRTSERGTSSQVVVKVLPSLISERCRLHPKLLIDLVRREVHQLLSTSSSSALSSDWIHRIPHCPRGLVEIINSRACRSAIMFNDMLEKGQCEELLRKLVRCTLPFQCAHGRPTWVALPAWGGGKGIEKHGMSFADTFRMWKHV